MAIDLKKVKEKLKSLELKNERKNYIWKPENGKQVIRIVPYLENADFPFIELFFNYEVTKRSVLSPITYGNPDPIAEFATKLKGTGISDDYKLGKQVEPKERYYAPIIVRGEEEEGVKYWGFGKTVYSELLSLINDPDYGDITDLENGRDITVEYKPKEDTGKSYPVTEVRAKPNQTKVGTQKNILDIIQKQKDIKDIFPEPTYQELDDMLKQYLNPEVDAAENEAGVPIEMKTEKNEHHAKSAEDLNDKFKNLFKDKKK